jgi:hypothetical protein
MVDTAEIHDDVPAVVEDDESVVDESDSVTTEDIMDSIIPRRMPAIRIQAHMDLPAWFVVLASYMFALGLGFFSNYSSSSCK